MMIMMIVMMMMRMMIVMRMMMMMMMMMMLLLLLILALLSNRAVQFLDALNERDAMYTLINYVDAHEYALKVFCRLRNLNWRNLVTVTVIHVLQKIDVFFSVNSTYNDEDSTCSLLLDFKNEINLLVRVTDCFVVEVGGCS